MLQAVVTFRTAPLSMTPVTKLALRAPVFPA
jgi:hypothetical protein